MDPQTLIGLFRRTVTDHYFDLDGRTGRAEFWYFMLCWLVVSIIAGLLSLVTLLPISALVGLALLLPVAGMGARRLQDVGRNGRLIWLLIIPSAIIQLFGLLIWGPFGALVWLLNLLAFVAFLVALYFWVQPGDAAPNAYGPVPPVFDPSKRVSTKR